MRYLLPLFLLLAAPAHAIAICAPRAIMVKSLAEGYQEHPAGIGITGAGVVELFTSEKSTWTLTLTVPKGLSCIVAVGESWETVPPPPPPEF
ncbi:MAG: hypothetical protein ACE5FS_14730 [Paracoccaceae bacterium]